MAGAGRPLLHAYFYPSSGAYLFGRDDGEDWIRAAFLSGGVMPSHHLSAICRSARDREGMALERPHYQRTAPNGSAYSIPTATRSNAFFRKVYGNETALWMRRWRWVLPRHGRAVRLRRRHRMGVSHFRMNSGVAAVVMPVHGSRNPCRRN